MAGTYDDAVVFVAGDFNNLNTNFLCDDYGLQQMVVTSTYGNKIIDKVFVSQPDVYNCMVVKSLLKTKHMAVILSPAIETERCMELGPRQKVPVFDLREPFVNKLRYYIGMYDWDSLLNDCSDIDLCYTRFLETLHCLIDVCIPCKLLLVFEQCCQMMVIDEIVQSMDA